MYAFDLIELNGDDLRRDPLEIRKATLANILARADRGIWLNDHIEDWSLLRPSDRCWGRGLRENLHVLQQSADNDLKHRISE